MGVLVDEMNRPLRLCTWPEWQAMGGKRDKPLEGLSHVYMWCLMEV